MGRLEQIRKEISIDNGYSSWPELSAIEPKIKVSMLQDEVVRRYAAEVARHNLERAASAARTRTNDESTSIIVDKETITSLEIELI